jgi:diguanylate cyclase (GGDEF)-like protein/PAS domain S-box-containing protein
MKHKHGFSVILSTFVCTGAVLVAYSSPFSLPIRLALIFLTTSLICVIVLLLSHRINKQLAADDTIKSQLLDHLPGVVFHCKNDEHWTMEFVSHGIRELCGYKEKEVIANSAISWENIISPEYRAYVRTNYEKAQAKNDKVQIEYKIIDKKGNEKWVYEQGMFVYDRIGDLLGIDGLIVDITDRKKIESELYRLSIFDHLTGIFNRRYIFERINTLIEESKRYERCFCVAILDIDFFKTVNDRHGHTYGDYVLCEFATICKNNLRPYDLIGRYGGEEFIVILMNSGRAESCEVLQRIKDTVQNHTFTYKGVGTNLAFSAGLSCVHEFPGTLTRDILINSADKRLYFAKENGRNKIIDQ